MTRKLILIILFIFSLLLCACANTYLLSASEKGNAKTVKTLLKEGANPNIKNFKGWPPLMLASSNGHTDVVKVLLENGADVNGKDKIGNTALMAAAIHGHADTVRMLLENDAEVNTRSAFDGFSALISAAGQGNFDVVKLLLENRADVNLKSNIGVTALMAASMSAAGGSPPPPETWMGPVDTFSFERHTNTVKLLLEYGADVNLKNDEGLTALMVASARGNTAAVKALLESGADVKVKHPNGLTALDFATQLKHFDTIEVLKNIADFAKKGGKDIKNVPIKIPVRKLQTEQSQKEHLPSLEDKPKRADAEESPDDLLVKKGRSQAKALGYNPVPVYMNEKNAISFVSGTTFSIRQGNWKMVEGDMVINVGDKPIKIDDYHLLKGEYITYDKEGMNKGNLSTSNKKSTQTKNKETLPPYTIEIFGNNPVRVKNPNIFSVVAGIRSGLRGKNFNIGPNSFETVNIPDGKYDIYFIYSNEPHALYKGSTFTLKGHGVEIQIVKVANGNYGISRVK